MERLRPIVVAVALETFLDLAPAPDAAVPQQKGKRPSLCAGCSHRAAYYAIKKTFPNGIFPSDIGCYTLAMNFGAIDTCHCMGACISQGEGFYFAYRNETNPPTIVVSIGDSTFFHAGVPALINAVFQKSRFIVAILDNATTAMTGNQPTPQVGIMADGTPGKPVYIAELVKGLRGRFCPGVRSLRSRYADSTATGGRPLLPFSRGRDGRYNLQASLSTGQVRKEIAGL